MNSNISKEQIAIALKQEELGMPLVDVIAQVGVTEEVFQGWKKQYVSQAEDVQDLKLLKEENHQLKQLVAELTLEIGRLKHADGHK